MNEEKILFERRRYRRFQVNRPSFVVFDTQSPRLGKILDISINGLAFRCTVDSEEVVNRSRTLDILFEEGNFYLEKLPFSSVSGRPRDNGLAPGSVSMRRRGVQFGYLDEHQQEKLANFIKSNTSGEI